MSAACRHSRDARHAPIPRVRVEIQLDERVIGRIAHRVRHPGVIQERILAMRHPRGFHIRQVHHVIERAPRKRRPRVRALDVTPREDVPPVPVARARQLRHDRRPT
eukprot:30931-Pelagococcus_subviridis.AAC.6